MRNAITEFSTNNVTQRTEFLSINLTESVKFIIETSVIASHLRFYWSPRLWTYRESVVRGRLPKRAQQRNDAWRTGGATRPLDNFKQLIRAHQHSNRKRRWRTSDADFRWEARSGEVREERVASIIKSDRRTFVVALRDLAVRVPRVVPVWSGLGCFAMPDGFEVFQLGFPFHWDLPDFSWLR